MSTQTHREQSLVALGAAIASNCVPCVEYHVPVAKKIGLDGAGAPMVATHRIGATLRIHNILEIEDCEDC